MAKKGSVLVVDDEEIMRDVLETLLSAEGYRVDLAKTGEDGLEAYGRRAYDVVLLDVSMPGMGGIEALKEMKHQNPDLQIIILTGHGTLQAGVEAMKVGAMDFMEKPVDINKLMAKISEAKNKKVLLVDKKHEDHIKEIMQTKSW